jgi:hypothetical protein
LDDWRAQVGTGFGKQPRDVYVRADSSEGSDRYHNLFLNDEHPRKIRVYVKARNILGRYYDGTLLNERVNQT